jgi:hypothetical protein
MRVPSRTFLARFYHLHAALLHPFMHVLRGPPGARLSETLLFGQNLRSTCRADP